MQTDIVRYKFGFPHEEAYGYSQACRAGDTLYLSGQVPTDEARQLVGRDDFATQVRTVYEKIDHILTRFGAAREDIIDETVFVVDPHKHWDAMRNLHLEYYKTLHPASTYVGVTALAMPGILVEIKITAWLGTKKQYQE